ncbi:lanthionine synthetase LanC family protein [Nonomuraea sp. NPDC048826]|uniref:class III lanthionine synthetase LanKC N-terminal domain-containing protein n=1 Tax=Nonomuraea sp. NPDC048826 TaxID=3364347 RepID=UPI00371A945C
MTEGAAGVEIEAQVRVLARAGGHRVLRDDPWLVIIPPDDEMPDHGWKLHVSTRAVTFPALVRRLLPVLLDEGCGFKLACSTAVLAELNDGITAPASVGKAVTVYPRPDRVRDLGLALVALLRGHEGPRVASDRRIDGAAPVYYRYGPFAAEWRTDPSGHTGLVIRGPDGEVFDGEADARGYRQPSWVTDPFPDATGPLPDTGLLLGGRYEVIEGIRESARGNVYRGVDRETDRQVVIKQARALVAESEDEADTRMRLRNERRILHALDGLPGVPRFLDHFRHADDEFLVITDEGPVDLGDDLERDGPYPLGDGPRSLRRLAGELAGILAEVHDRGVVMRDVKPRNIIVREAGAPRVSLVDFGIAALDGLHLPGGTPGYAPDRQRVDAPPRPADDLYALGMTLLEAATGLPPVYGVGSGQARTRALETVRARWGAAPDGVIGALADLVHDDVAVAEAAVLRLRTGGDRPATSLLPPPPVADAGSAAGLAAALLDLLTTKVDAALAEPHGRRRPNPTLYSGPAGIGLELLRHGDHPGARDRISRLLARVTADADTSDLGPALLAGRTGVDVFVREAREWLGLPAAERRRPDPLTGPDAFDLVSGTAGIGLGHLWFFRRDGDPRDLDVGRRCAETLAAAVPERPGLAHGLAGVVAFDLFAADHVDVGRAGDRLAALIDAAVPLIERAAAGAGDPLATASWCNGLTGVARVLAEAGRRGNRPDCTRLALTAGDALTGWIPRSVHLGQCCGVAGIGDLMLDLSFLPGGERFTDHAYAAARQIVLRSAGTHSRPEPVSFSTTDRDGVSWAIGLAGILGFVRRLRDRGGPRLLPETGPDRP